MYDEYYDDVMASSWPVLEVTEISFGQTIDAPLTVTEKLTLSGEVSSHNGRGDGSITCLIKRVTSDSSSHELHASIGKIHILFVLKKYGQFSLPSGMRVGVNVKQILMTII